MTHSFRPLANVPGGAVGEPRRRAQIAIPETLAICGYTFLLDRKRCRGRVKDAWGHFYKCRAIWVMSHSNSDSLESTVIAYCREHGADVEAIKAVAAEQADTITRRQREETDRRQRRRIELAGGALLDAVKAALPHLHWANTHGDRCDEVIGMAEAAVAAAKGEVE